MNKGGRPVGARDQTFSDGRMLDRLCQQIATGPDMGLSAIDARKLLSWAVETVANWNTANMFIDGTIDVSVKDGELRYELKGDTDKAPGGLSVGPLGGRPTTNMLTDASILSIMRRAFMSRGESTTSPADLLKVLNWVTDTLTDYQMLRRYLRAEIWLKVENGGIVYRPWPEEVQKVAIGRIRKTEG